MNHPKFNQSSSSNIIIGQKITFRRQQIIDGFIVDFYCHAVGLVIEVDGEIHEQQIEYDLEREKVISSRGLCVLRVKNEDVRNNLDEVLRWISQAC